MLPADDDEVLGVLAELATIEDANLSKVLAHFYSSHLAVLVVESRQCEQRMNLLLGGSKLLVPDILVLDLCMPTR